VSLVSAALIYVLSLYYLALSDLSSGKSFVPLVSAVVASIATMVVAGALAEDDPPLDGKHEILKYLATYGAREPEKFGELWDRINQGTWVLTDLVAFAASEDERCRLDTQRISCSPE